MREILVYAISGLGALFIFGYSVHIFIGGMVSEESEIAAIAVVELLALAAIGWMVRDVVRRRGR
ncbi:MAG: hypothetical protein D6682_06360 [Zetaproteobacteria bacterium]|nr:MAG: hypothetical protein D6682_06360 [Zetaproteobacteria bacterium]